MSDRPTESVMGVEYLGVALNEASTDVVIVGRTRGVVGGGVRVFVETWWRPTKQSTALF